MQTLVVMALKVESQGLFEQAGYHPFYCGVGSIKATFNLTQQLLRQPVQRVVNLGTVGSHRLPFAQLVECTSFVQRQPHDFFKITPEILKSEALTDLPQVLCGSADFVEKASPLTECDVFDMEAYALAYVCKKLDIPFTSLKYVTDASNENLAQDWKNNLAGGAQALLSQLRKLKT